MAMPQLLNDNAQCVKMRFKKSKACIGRSAAEQWSILHATRQILVQYPMDVRDWIVNQVQSLQMLTTQFILSNQIQRSLLSH